MKRHFWLGHRFVVILAAAIFVAGFSCSKKEKFEPKEVLRFGIAVAPKTLDPAKAEDVTSQTELKHGYEGLLQYSYHKRPYALEPALLESMPEPGPEGVQVLRLKKGILFHDDPCFKSTGGKGREVTAEDWIFSFLRVAHAKTQSYAWAWLSGSLVGLDAWRVRTADQDLLRNWIQEDFQKGLGIRALDRYTIEVKPLGRSRKFQYLLASPALSVVPFEAVEHYGNEFGNHVVGTGAFRLDPISKDPKWVWTRNPTFRQEFDSSFSTTQPLPYADQILVERISDPQQSWKRMLAQEVEWMDLAPVIYEKVITAGKHLSKEVSEQGLRLEKIQIPNLSYVAFNLSDKVLGKNRLLRQALSLSLQAEPWIDLFYGGQAQAAFGPLVPGLLGFDFQLSNPLRKFNLVKAREHLAKAGFPGGEGLAPLVYVTSDDEGSRQLTEYVSKSFQQIGVKTEIRPLALREFEAAKAARSAQIWNSTWRADFPDPEAILFRFYGSANDLSANESLYQNPTFDRTFDKWVAEKNPKTAQAHLKALVDLLTEDAPWIYGIHRVSYRVVKKDLANYQHHDFDFGISKYLRSSGKRPK
ncbi:MAG: hypothetical protein JNL01_11235 [Bdellovibrionales bacterium]|nr:hypothetical protein [Bdellovibrionales bacterium]